MPAIAYDNGTTTSAVPVLDRCCLQCQQWPKRSSGSPQTRQVTPGVRTTLAAQRLKVTGSTCSSIATSDMHETVGAVGDPCAAQSRLHRDLVDDSPPCARAAHGTWQWRRRCFSTTTINRTAPAVLRGPSRSGQLRAIGAGGYTDLIGDRSPIDLPA